MSRKLPGLVSFLWVRYLSMSTVVLVLVLVLGLVLVFFASSQITSADTTTTLSRFDTRTIKSPSSESIGSLLLVSAAAKPQEERVTKSTEVGIARGSVTVKIPAGKILMFEANQKVFQHPTCLLEITPPGSIDAVKIGFMAMKDEEEGLCDKALKYIPRFRNLQYLDVNQSDATDAGLVNSKTLTKLKELSITESQVNGSFLKELGALQQLSHLKMDRCALKAANLAYLQNLKGLTSLEVRWSGLDDNCVEEITKCTQLKFLDLSRNHKISDKSVKDLAKLKELDTILLNETGLTDHGLEELPNLNNLTELDLSRTKVSNEGIKYLAKFKKLTALHLCRTRVTVEGMRPLQSLKLKLLTLPRASYEPTDTDKLTKMFPRTKLEIVGNDAPSDLQLMYGPSTK